MNNTIILGCQRSGKTTLTKMISQKENVTVFSADSLVSAFQNAVPELNITRETKLDVKSPIFSKFLASYFGSFCKEYPKNKYVIEACQLFPRDVKSQPIFKKCQIVCLGYPNASIDEIFNNIRTNDEKIKNAYTNFLSDDELRKVIKSWIFYSQFLKKQSDKLGIPFYETNKNRDEILNGILNQITREDIEMEK